jgi:mono/diheme cytochrome c family protein
MRLIKTVLIVIALLIVGLGAYIYSGVYNIGADSPHTPPVYGLLQLLRERSIQRHSAGIRPPKLNDPKMIAEGAEHYAAMCSGCHLAPGLADTEIRPGLYPTPPEFYKHPPGDPGWQFWVIKHGVKLTAMPAWGGTHDDLTIWAIVAFLQKLPSLTPEQYAQMTANAAEEHEHHEAAEHPPEQPDGGQKATPPAAEQPQTPAPAPAPAQSGQQQQH